MGYGGIDRTEYGVVQMREDGVSVLRNGMEVVGCPGNAGHEQDPYAFRQSVENTKCERYVQDEVLGVGMVEAEAERPIGGAHEAFRAMVSGLFPEQACPYAAKNQHKPSRNGTLHRPIRASRCVESGQQNPKGDRERRLWNEIPYFGHSCQEYRVA